MSDFKHIHPDTQEEVGSWEIDEAIP